MSVITDILPKPKYEGDKALAFYVCLYFIEKRSLRTESTLKEVKGYMNILLDCINDFNMPDNEKKRGSRAIKKCGLYLESRGLDLTPMYNERPQMREIVINCN